jgi:hypothetical protein
VDQSLKKQKEVVGKDSILEKLVWASIPICISCIGYLMSELSLTRNKLTILENKVAIVVNTENKSIPPQGTTIEMEQIRANAQQSRADMKLELIKEIAQLQTRISVLEYKRK